MITVYRKPNSTSGSMTLDGTAVGLQTFASAEGGLEIHFTCGMTGGKTDFCIELSGKELSEAMADVISALTEAKAKQLSDYSEEDLYAALKTKMKGD